MTHTAEWGVADVRHPPCVYWDFQLSYIQSRDESGALGSLQPLSGCPQSIHSDMNKTTHKAVGEGTKIDRLLSCLIWLLIVPHIQPEINIFHLFLLKFMKNIFNIDDNNFL